MSIAESPRCCCFWPRMRDQIESQLGTTICNDPSTSSSRRPTNRSRNHQSRDTAMTGPGYSSTAASKLSSTAGCCSVSRSIPLLRGPYDSDQLNEPPARTRRTTCCATCCSGPSCCSPRPWSVGLDSGRYARLRHLGTRSLLAAARLQPCQGRRSMAVLFRAADVSPPPHRMT